MKKSKNWGGLWLFLLFTLGYLYFEALFRVATGGTLAHSSTGFLLLFALCWGLFGYLIATLIPSISRPVTAVQLLLTGIIFLVEYFTHRYFKVFYDVAERAAGTTKWSTRSLIRYAFSNIISFSSAPLNMVTVIGIGSLLFSFIMGIQTFIRWLCNDAIEGFTTVILIMLLLGGCILIGLGLIGQYLAAIYDEVKQRPRYIIRRDTEKEKKDGR